MRWVMNRDRIARKLVEVIGRKNVARLQSWVKYMITFKHIYRDGPMMSIGIKTVVFIIDGKTPHGGLSDRLRGLFSIYYYCKQKGYHFKIAWNYPFRLQDYLKPANENWIAEDWELASNRKMVSFRFFNSYSMMNNKEKDYFELLDFRKPIAHVYSNVTLHEELFPVLFNELFVPVETLQHAVERNISKIGGEFYSMSFRFIGLLGDFKDKDSRFNELDDEADKENYIEHCLNAIRNVYNAMSKKRKILVTTDSSLFLVRLDAILYVYTIPGVVGHMDVDKNSYELHFKTFLDFIMISKAIKCYSYQYGKMYSATKFAKTAALIGGKEYEVMKE